MPRSAYWIATGLAGTLLVAAAVLRVAGADESGSSAEDAGRLVGSVLGALLIGALLVFLVTRVVKSGRPWFWPLALGLGAVLNVLVALADAGEELRACEDVPPVQAAALLPSGASSRPVPPGRLGAATERLPAGSSFDAVFTEGSTVAALSSDSEALDEDDLFAGFASRTDPEAVDVAGREGRIAEANGGFILVLGAGDCAAAVVAGLDRGAVEALAAELRLPS